MSQLKNIPFKLFVAEFVGTALLMSVGLSVVIFDWGQGTVMNHLIPNHGLRRAFTGFFFGTTGCLITLSPVGRISGAHINPIVSLAFWMRGKMKTQAMLGYIASQMLGSVVGCLPLLLWKVQGSSVGYGNTVPGPAGTWPAFIGETVTTACFITVLFSFVGSSKLRNYTPFTIPFLFSFMVWAEAPLSGCSTNPARTFGPAVISQVYTDFWVYLLGPLLGVIAIVSVFRLLRLHHHYPIEAARVGYHDHPSPDCIKNSSSGKPIAT